MIIEYLTNLFKPLNMEKLGEIKNTDLMKLFKVESNVIDLDATRVYTLDEKYDLTDKSNIEKFLNKDFTNLKFYLADCDKFALQLWANFKKKYPTYAFGFAIGVDHAFNVFIDNQNVVWIVEPQTDELILIPKGKYKMRVVLI